MAVSIAISSALLEIMCHTNRMNVSIIISCFLRAVSLLQFFEFSGGVAFRAVSPASNPPPKG